MGKHVFGSLAVLAVLIGARATAGAENVSPIGRHIEPFAARDFRGKPTSLADFSDSRLVVVAFLGTECPLAKLYAPRLVELARQFDGRGVAFIGVNSNQQDSITELAHYAAE